MPKQLSIILIAAISLIALATYFKLGNSKPKIADNFIKPKATKPNIIVILIDDAGYADFGFMGSKDLKTPHIDALAKSGTIFTDAHASSTVCAPSRAGILLGNYQQRYGFEANHTGDQESGDIGLPDNVPTLANVLKSNNYKTVAIGKWHLGATTSDLPNNRGFDDFYGFLGGGRSYFPMKNPDQLQMLQHNGKKVEFEGYLTDVLGDYSVNYIEQNKNHPFFMYLSYNAVHTPMEAKKEDLETFKNHPRKKLAAMTHSLDENIGKLIKKLEEHHLRENTLIFFLSDNGGAANNQSNNGILKGWKGNEFEGGHRVPFVMSWPSQIPQNKVFNGLTSSLDIFATCIGEVAASNGKTINMDGVNLIPFLKDSIQKNPHNSLYWRKLEESAVRIGNKKLINLSNFGYVVYDLEKDIREINDISMQNIANSKALLSSLKSWESEMMEPLWKEDEDWMRVTFHIHQQLMQNKEAKYLKPKKINER